jgi:NADH-quinone oxidoreductase subunit G
MDALGSSIRIDVRGREVMRILPRNHDGVNEEWISDKTRFVWDGLRRQRLDKPYVRRDGKLKPATWDEAFRAIAEKVQGATVAAVAGELVPVEAMWSLKTLLASLGSDRVECRTDGAKLPIGNRSGVIGAAEVADIDTAGAVLVVGSNPRTECPVLNARIRKAWLNGAEVAVVGQPADLTFPAHHLGTGPSALSGDTGDAIVSTMTEAGNPVIVLGQGALTRDDGAAVLGNVMALAGKTGAKLLILHTAASRVGGMEIGFAHEGGLSGALDGADVIFNLGADEIDLPDGAFVVYQGHHGDRGAHRADVILPGATYAEQSGIYVNTEGRVQMGTQAGFPPGDAREDWAILRALSAVLGHTLPWNSLGDLRANLFEAHPHLARIDQIEPAEWQPLDAGDMDGADFGLTVRDHYLVNAVCRASEVMAELSRMAAARQQQLAAE